MPTVAEQLRAARETRKLSVTEVAEITKIRTDHIRALEEGNFDVFVAPVYIRGFTRTYATLLKLDVPAIIQALTVELGETEKFAEPPPLSKERKGILDFLMLQLSKVNWQKSAVGLGGLAVIGILILAVIIILVLSYYNISIKAVVESPTGQENLGYVGGGTRSLWTTYLAGPASYLWNDVWINIFWRGFISNMERIRDGLPL